MMEIIERKGMKDFYCKQMTFTVIHQNTIYNPNPNPKIFAHRCVFTLSQTGCQFAPVPAVVLHIKSIAALEVFSP